MGVELTGKLKKSKYSFVHGLSIALSGTVGAQIISLLLMPVISRLYTEADFGFYGYYSALLSIVGTVVTLQYNQAVVLPKDDHHAFNLFTATCFIVLLSSAFFGIVLIAANFAGLQLLNKQSFGLMCLMFFAVLSSGFYNVFFGWCIRVKAFKNLSLSQVARTLTASICWVVLGLAGWGEMGLVFGLAMGFFCALLVLSPIVLNHLKHLRNWVFFKSMRDVVVEYRDFPLYSAPQNFVNAVSAGVPVLLLTYFYGVKVAGAYAFGQKCLSVPMNVVKDALRQVLFQRVSEVYNLNGDLWKLYLKSVSGLAAVVLFPSIIVFVWIPSIFVLVFGNEWQIAGEYARWLILWMAVGFCNVPAVLNARVLRMQKQMFIYDCLVLLARVCALILCGMIWEPINAIICFSIIGMVASSILVIWIGKKIFVGFV